MQDFRELIVWRRAHALALAIRHVARAFPRLGHSDNRSQLVRAADSMVSNIVEGCGAATRKEFARYLDISIKSASEVDYRLELARDDGSIRYIVWKPLGEQVVEVRKMLFGLRKSVLGADAAEEKRRRGVRGPGTDDR